MTASHKQSFISPQSGCRWTLCSYSTLVAAWRVGSISLVELPSLRYGLDGGDRVAVIAFARTAIAEQALTSDWRAVKRGVQDAVSDPRVNPSGTRIYDAVDYAVQFLMSSEKAMVDQQIPRLRAILIITDNASSGSDFPETNVLKDLDRSDSSLFALITPWPQPDSLGYFVPSPGRNHQNVGTLAAATGGRVDLLCWRFRKDAFQHSKSI